MPKIYDLEYTECKGFVMFMSNTPEGHEAWNEIAKYTEGTGKIFPHHLASTLYQLRKAGYSVRKSRKNKTSIQEILKDISC